MKTSKQHSLILFFLLSLALVWIDKGLSDAISHNHNEGKECTANHIEHSHNHNIHDTFCITPFTNTDTNNCLKNSHAQPMLVEFVKDNYTCTIWQPPKLV